jgi:hypothetical protein
MTTYCKVRWCRFASTHVTKGHKCGKCGIYGHGDSECYYDHLKRNLLRFHNETLPDDLHCIVEDCNNKQYHTTDAHHCQRCHIRTTHTPADCNGSSVASTISSTTTTTLATNITNVVQKSFDVKCPLCREDNHISKPVKLYGISDICCICTENVVNVLMPVCGHCCICLDCLPTLAKY